MDKRVIIKLKENVIASWAKDIVTVLSFASLWYLNAKYLSGSVVIDFFVGWVVVFFFAKQFKTKENEYTVKEAIEHLKTFENGKGVR